MAGRTQARNVVYVQWRIDVRCVIYDVQVPWDGWYIGICEETVVIMWLMLLLVMKVGNR